MRVNRLNNNNLIYEINDTRIDVIQMDFDFRPSGADPGVTMLVSHGSCRVEHRWSYDELTVRDSRGNVVGGGIYEPAPWTGGSHDLQPMWSLLMGPAGLSRKDAEFLVAQMRMELECNIEAPDVAAIKHVCGYHDPCVLTGPLVDRRSAGISRAEKSGRLIGEVLVGLGEEVKQVMRIELTEDQYGEIREQATMYGQDDAARTEALIDGLCEARHRSLASCPVSVRG